jgi:subtilisin family serine protease
MLRARNVWLALGAAVVSACGGGAPEVEVEPAEQVARFVRVERPVRGQYLIHLKEGEEGAVARELAAAHGGEVLHVYRHVLRGFSARLSEEQALRLARHPAVERVEEDEEFTLQSTWGLDRIDQRALPLNGEYSCAGTGAGVNVYIVDTGIRATHTEFAGRIRAGHTVVYDGQGINDCTGHGTHVAGIIGGATHGVARGVNIIPVRIYGCSASTTTSMIVAAMDWVRINHRKPAVVNLSLGGSANTSIDSAVSNLISAGLPVVIAAGNNSADACNYSPARVLEAVTVAGTTQTDSRATWSNFGSCVDLFAPGASITAAWHTGDSVFNTISGTSMSTAFVSGAVAQYLQFVPTASPASVTKYILTRASFGVVSNPGTNTPNRLLYCGP